MKSVSLLNTAATIAALTVLTAALILVPEPMWSLVTLITAIGFASSVGYIFYIPSSLRQKQQRNDVQQIVAIGSLGFLSTLLLITMGGSFILALNGYQKIGLALVIFGVGEFFVTNLVLNAALEVVNDISNKWSQPSKHFDWQNQVTLLISQTVHQESIDQLHLLKEELNYLASDIPEGSPQDTFIEQALNAMALDLQSDHTADLSNRLNEIKRHLIQRDIYLRAARHK